MGNSQGRLDDHNGQVNLNHFRLLRVVGRGAFGKVRIVEHKDTGLSFALKYIRKDEVVRSESVRNIIRERRMLEHVNHPFICNLRYSFQDIEYMYLVVDLMSGGDLRFHISRKTFTEEAVRFWIAELGCALRYVHKQGIIHRDVKPDNVLLDADGHVHLTDFNVASDIIRGKVMKSKSGTLAYLGPEVYAGQGYDVRADWWSLGVLFYECIYNKRPFEGNSESALSISVQAANPKYPVTQPPVSLVCMYAMQSALTADPNKRMGSTWESFIYNDFFSPIDFDQLESKQIEPVFVPSSDKTNFDASYDLEELLLEEAPLEARARRQKPRERLKNDATDKEIREEELYRMMETDFRPFDYTAAALKKLAAQAKAAEQSQQYQDDRPLTAAANAPSHAPSPPLEPNRPAPPTDADGAAENLEPQARTIDERGMPPPSLGGNPPGSTPGFQRRGPSGRINTYQQSYTNTKQQPSGRAIAESPTGGIQVTFDVGGSWSDLARHARRDSTLPADAVGVQDAVALGKQDSGGVFGFLSRKKGRTNSPGKPKERGVLGKEGARVVIG